MVVNRTVLVLHCYENKTSLATPCEEPRPLPSLYFKHNAI